MHVRALFSFLRHLLQWLALSDGQLKERVFRGGAWLVIGNTLDRLAGLIKLGILARLLTPADFGLIGIAMLLIHWFEQFSQTGFNQALVRTRGDIQPYLNTFWTVQILRGIMLATVFFLAAPVAVWFFENPGALPVIQAMALLVLLRGFINPAVVYLTRELDFQRFVMWNMWQVLSSLAVAIPLALVYRNVWALVLSLLVGQAVSTIVSYRIYSFHPRLSFDRGRAREMMQFGKWIFWRNALGALVTSVDDLIVGKLLGASALGLYQMALRLTAFPTHQITPILQRVIYPAFARLRQADQLRGAYLQLLKLSLLLVLPAICILFALPHVVIRVFLGEQWMTIVTVVQILAFSCGLNAVRSVANPMFESMGRPDIPVKLRGARLILYLLLIYPGTQRWGITGTALAVVCTDLITTTMQFFFLRSLIGLGLVQAAANIRQGAVAALPLLLVGILSYTFGPLGNILPGLTTFAIIICLAIMWVFLRPHLALLRRA
jgi:O-antigen/teichoic acid export membrane protein